MKKLLVLLVLAVGGYFLYQHVQGNSEKSLEPLYDEPYVVVYGQKQCKWTQRCLRELKEQGMATIFEDIDRQEVKMEIFPRVDAAGHKRNQIVIPIIDVNGHILVGYELDKIRKFYYQPES